MLVQFGYNSSAQQLTLRSILPNRIAMSLTIKFAVAAVSLLVTAGAVAQDDKEAIVYKDVDGQKLKIHVSKPADWKPTDIRPAVVFFHGGGWVGGKPGQFDAHCKHLNERGMVCFQVQYRLLSKDKSASDLTPTKCIHDAKSAMRWVRKHASEFGIASNQIAAGGGSAGGHLATFLGTTDGTDDPNDDVKISARANAMLLFNPVYNNGPNENGLKGWGTARVGDRYKEFSPAHNISSDDAPSIVFLGTEDKLIPTGVAQAFQNKMLEQGVRSELRLYAGAGHGFFNKNKSGGWYPFTIEEADEFLVSLGWLK